MKESVMLNKEIKLISEDVIQVWIIGKIATQLGVNPDTVDITMPFSYYGLDSVAAMSLSSELEDWLGKKLSPTLAWDFPTIERLAQHLASVV